MLLPQRLGNVILLNFALIFVSICDGIKYGRLGADWATNIVQYTGRYVGRISHLNASDGLELSESDIEKLHIWPKGVIPYYIDDFSFDKILRDRIRSFLMQTSGITGLQFEELSDVPDDPGFRWVMFINRQQTLDCTDYPFTYFTNKGIQQVVLGYNCLGSGRQLPALLLSLLGVPPQHNAPNRDRSVKINLDNVMPGKKQFFKILPDDMWLFHDLPYDFHSAGHYSHHKYTANGLATIQPREDLTDVELGDGKVFSIGDILKIGMLYKYITKNEVNEATALGCKKLFENRGKLTSYDSEKADTESEEQVKEKSKKNAKSKKQYRNDIKRRATPPTTRRTPIPPKVLASLAG